MQRLTKSFKRMNELRTQTDTIFPWDLVKKEILFCPTQSTLDIFEAEPGSIDED